MKLRKSRESKRGRIEIIPMIDVMFFLLATFMLASLSMQNLNSLPVNLPKGKAQPMREKAPVTLTVTKEGKIFVDKTAVTLDSMKSAIESKLDKSDPSIVISADTGAQNGLVVEVMLRARQAGAEHFLIAVKHEE